MMMAFASLVGQVRHLAKLNACRGGGIRLCHADVCLLQASFSFRWSDKGARLRGKDLDQRLALRRAHAPCACASGEKMEPWHYRWGTSPYRSFPSHHRIIFAVSLE